jgi:hypothetical protein
MRGGLSSDLAGTTTVSRVDEESLTYLESPDFIIASPVKGLET